MDPHPKATHPRAVEGETSIDVNQAARVARRSPETIRRWVWSGKLPAQRSGRRLLVSPDDVAALAAERDDAPSLTLAEWAESAREAIRTSGPPGQGNRSAADLVLVDRHARSDGQGAR